MSEWIELIKKTGLIKDLEPLSGEEVPATLTAHKAYVHIRVVDETVDEFHIWVKQQHLTLHIEFFDLNYQGIAAWIALLEEGAIGVHLELDDISISKWRARSVYGTDLLQLEIDWEGEMQIDAIVSRIQLIQAFRDEMRRFFSSLTNADLIGGNADEGQIKERLERWNNMRNNLWLFPEGQSRLECD